MGVLQKKWNLHFSGDKFWGELQKIFVKFRWNFQFLGISFGGTPKIFCENSIFLGRNPCRKYSTNWNHLQFYKRIAIKIFFVGFKILVKTPTKNVYLLLVVGGWWLVGGWLDVFFFCTLRRVDRIPELHSALRPRSARNYTKYLYLYGIQTLSCAYL